MLKDLLLRNRDPDSTAVDLDYVDHMIEIVTKVILWYFKFLNWDFLFRVKMESKRLEETMNYSKKYFWIKVWFSFGPSSIDTTTKRCEPPAIRIPRKLGISRLPFERVSTCTPISETWFYFSVSFLQIKLERFSNWALFGRKNNFQR